LGVAVQELGHGSAGDAREAREAHPADAELAERADVLADGFGIHVGLPAAVGNGTAPVVVVVACRPATDGAAAALEVVFGVAVRAAGHAAASLRWRGRPVRSSRRMALTVETATLRRAAISWLETL